MAWGDSDFGGGLEGAPDVGTIGGTMQDSFGESSATMGGGLGADQGMANQGVNDYSWGYDFGSAGFSNPMSFDYADLANMFGSQYSQGLPTTPTDFSYSSSPSFSSFMDSPFGKSVRGLLGMVNPALGAGINAVYAGYRGDVPGALGSLAGGLTGNGLIGTGVALGTAAAQGKNVAGPAGSAVGGTLGSMFGGQVAGPVGAYAGGMLGSQVGRAAATGQGLPGATGPAQGFTDNGGGNMNWGNLIGAGVGGLAGLYQANRAAKAAEGNTQDLGALFGPNSAYAQQLRQQLERRDAASGRRSQYGPREVELQAKLAQMAAQYGPNISQQNMAAQNAAQARRNAQMNMLLGLGRQSGLFNWAGNRLSDLFSGSGTSGGVDYSISNPSTFYQPQAESSYGFQPTGGGLGLQFDNSSWNW